MTTFNNLNNWIMKCGRILLICEQDCQQNKIVAKVLYEDRCNLDNGVTISHKKNRYQSYRFIVRGIVDYEFPGEYKLNNETLEILVLDKSYERAISPTVTGKMSINLYCFNTPTLSPSPFCLLYWNTSALDM